MPILEIDEDVYQYLLTRAVRIGEDGSSILRRELGLPQPNGRGPGATSPLDDDEGPPEVRAVQEFVTDPRFAAQRVVTKKYLRLMGFLARMHGEDFERALEVRGRNRLYFGRSWSEIAATGKSLHPQQIPETEYWAMTNSDTAQKQDIAGEVMKVLGYPNDVIRQVRGCLR